MTKANDNALLIDEINGKSKADAMDILVPAIGFKAAEVFWKENGAKSKARGFRALFYKELETHDMNKDEVKEFCKTHGSPNDAKHYTHYVTIAELVQNVRG